MRKAREYSHHHCVDPFFVQTSRREFALNLSKRRYRRLQADMLRSRLELADTLGVLETERSEHISKIKDAEIRRVELENALRAADQVCAA